MDAWWAANDNLRVANDDPPKNFVRAWREERGFTQERLAHEIGVTHPTISRIENGEGYRKDTIYKIAAALDVSVGDLLEKDPREAATVDRLWNAIPRERRLMAARLLKSMAEEDIPLDELPDRFHDDELINRKDGAAKVTPFRGKRTQR